MSSFHVVRNGYYVTISNYHLRDKTLSLKAKGLQSVLLGLPESWHFTVRGLAEICIENKDTITAILQELEQHGYLVRKQSRMPDGKLGEIEYWVYGMPIESGAASPCPKISDTVVQPCPKKPDTVLPCPKKPDTVNSDGYNNIINNNKLNNKINNNNISTSNTEVQSTLEGARTNEAQSKERSEICHVYGQYRNVLLTDNEFDILKKEFPDWERRIDELSEYIASTGRTYKNHLITIRSWAAKQKRQQESRYRYGYKKPVSNNLPNGAIGQLGEEEKEIIRRMVAEEAQKTEAERQADIEWERENFTLEQFASVHPDLPYKP